MDPVVREVIGYVGSVGVAISLMMSNIVKLRIINLIGAAVFSAYGFFINMEPNAVFVLNGFIALTDIYYLIQMKREKDYFSILEIRNRDSAYLEKFIEYYRNSDKVVFPQDFDMENLNEPHAIFTLRNVNPAGLFVYEARDDGVIEVKLDYVAPAFRDMKTANFLYCSYLDKLRKQGYHTFEVVARTPLFRGYVQDLGFVQDENSDTLFRKSI